MVISIGVKQMNIELLQSFVEAAKQKSLSKAAKAQNLSQPAYTDPMRP
jgi:LysR family transcriptional regulator, transcription activator of glutamate synthase operon